VALTGIVPAPGRDQYWRFHAQSLVLSRRYNPPPLPGPVLVIVSDSDEREARASWAPHLTGPWQLRRVPGDHRSFLREPYVATTADLVTQALREAQGDAVGSMGS
jgi:thioesterase domain-containing protein